MITLKKLIIIFLFLSFNSANGQDLTLQDMKNSVLLPSVDKIDSLLRLKGYKLTSFPSKDRKDSFAYQFTKNITLGNLDVVYVVVVNNNYILTATFDNDLNFYRLKSECEHLQNIHEQNEENNNGNYTRFYCDGKFQYSFNMTEIKNIGMVYYVHVLLLTSSCP
jgi:hypothetical protein